MVITLLRVSVAAWSATPVRALYHLCLSLNLTRVNQSPSPFFMENGNDSRLIWASKNCCNARLLGQVLIDTTIGAGASDDTDGAKNSLPRTIWTDDLAMSSCCTSGHSRVLTDLSQTPVL